jgi:hypothetical protein
VVSTEEEVADAVVAVVVGEDLLTHGVVEVPRFEAATVVGEDSMTVVGLGDAPGGGMCFAHLQRAPVNPPF